MNFHDNMATFLQIESFFEKIYEVLQNMHWSIKANTATNKLMLQHATKRRNETVFTARMEQVTDATDNRYLLLQCPEEFGDGFSIQSVAASIYSKQSHGIVRIVYGTATIKSGLTLNALPITTFDGHVQITDATLAAATSGVSADVLESSSIKSLQTVYLQSDGTSVFEKQIDEHIYVQPGQSFFMLAQAINHTPNVTLSINFFDADNNLKALIT